MTGEKQTHKRKKYFINTKFQIRFILKFCFLLLLGVIISTGLLFLFSQDTLTSTFENSKLRIQSTGLAILPSVILTNLITLTLIAIAAVIVTVFISHRIAGPLFRFEKEFKEIGQGDLTKKVVLRKNDQVSAMADSINEMVSELHAKLSSIQQIVEQIRQTASRTKGNDDLIRELDDLKHMMNSSFKI